MYKCEFCQQLQAAGVPSVLIPVQTRSVTSPYRKGAQPLLPPKENRSRLRHRLREHRDDPGCQGQEIVRELRCCLACVSGMKQERGSLEWSVGSA